MSSTSSQRRRHHHHHHHQHFKQEDLVMRRQKGSVVTLNDDRQVGEATEQDEAQELNKADLDDMASKSAC